MASTEQTPTLVCYRHPKTETAVTCSDCGRPICTECMVFAAVGIKCPECAGQPTGVKKAATRARGAAVTGTGALVTKVLIAVNVAVFLAQLSQGDAGERLTSELFAQGSLYGPAVAAGEWWRLVTASFLHANLLHLLFNMVMLWWFGGPLETLLGRGRFIAVYLVSVLAGSAGSLLLLPDSPTVGASGAVFGILGAGLVLERRGINVFGGAALLVAVFNLAFAFLLAAVSIGGHIGGLVGGMLAILVLGRFGRGHAAYAPVGVAGIAGLVVIGIASVAIAYARVRGYA